MSKPRRARFVALSALLHRHRPDVDPAAITDGRVHVDGRVVDNPAARVRADAAIRVVPRRRLRGEVKLSHALATFAVAVDGRVAADLGASAGGFTTALLDAGARRVYAIDVGVGQLVGRLRADPRVVVLEGHNVGALTSEDVPEPVAVVTMDVGYLPVADAVGQLGALTVTADAELVALVKPTFELRRGAPVLDDEDLAKAVALAITGVDAAGWRVVATTSALRTGRAGAQEVFVHARRRRSDRPPETSG